MSEFLLFLDSNARNVMKYGLQEFSTKRNTYYFLIPENSSKSLFSNLRVTQM